MIDDPTPLDLGDTEARLKTAFIARFGVDVAEDLTAETMAWAWEHRGELGGVDNPVGYLFRVGQSKSRRLLRWRREKVRFPTEAPAAGGTPWVEPALPAALQELSEEARTAVVLTQCFEWTYGEVADLLDVPLHTVRNRVHRGLTELRTALGASK